MTTLANSRFSYDWLTLTIFAQRHEVLPFVAELGITPANLEDTGHGTKGFARREYGPEKFQLNSEPGAGREYCTLVMPGAALDWIGDDRLSQFLNALCEAGSKGDIRWQPSRVDLAFDTQDFTTDAIREAYQGGHVKCHARSFNQTESHERGKRTGHTLYFGSRFSDAMLRVYHKTNGNSFGDEPFTRLELELKGERASAALLEVLNNPFVDTATAAGQILIGFFTITLDWWQEWINGFAANWRKLPASTVSLQKTEKWLHGQVLPSLTAYLYAKSQLNNDAAWDELESMLKKGGQQLKPRHWRMIADYLSSPAVAASTAL